MTRVRFTERPEGTATMLSGQPNAVNYYRWIVRELSPYLGTRILDIGGGYGSHLEHILIRNPELVTSIDLSDTFVEMMRDRFQQYPQFFAQQFDFGLDDARAELVKSRFDTITCLNVLEHIEDDVTALKHMYEILHARQGTLLLQVPAHELLYGTMDSLAGHFRRYSRSYLRTTLLKAGFHIDRLFFFNSFGALPWFINARLLKPKTLEAQNLNTQLVIYDRYFIPVLRRVEALIKFPFGQSLMAVAKAD